MCSSGSGSVLFFFLYRGIPAPRPIGNRALMSFSALRGTWRSHG